MQRRAFLLPLILSSALALSGCGFVVVHTARKVYRDVTQAETEVAQGLARYRDALLRNDADQAAALFAEDGELARGDAAPLKGRAAIRGALVLPEGWQTGECEWQASSTQIDGEHARQQGRFRQAGTAPGSAPAWAQQGRFELQWQRQAGQWRILRLHTEPA